MQRSLALVGLLMCLAGCSPVPASQTPLPSLQPLRLVYSPDSRPALPAFDQCSSAQPGLAMLADEVPVTVINPTEADLWLRLGVPENWGGYAVQLAEERIVFLVHQKNPIRSLNLDEIRSIYSGQAQSWDQMGGTDQSIQVWALPPSNEARQTVDQIALGGLALSDQAYLAASPGRMLEAVASDPGAIGFLPEAWVVSTVKVVALPSDLQSSLTSPLLALSISEPEGQVRELLECLQHGTGREILKTPYSD